MKVFRRRKTTKRESWVLLGVLALSLLCGLAFLNPYLDPDGDNAGFLVLAKSIASGRGFTSINFPEYSPHTFYLPLYPLVLAPFVATWPGQNLLPKLPSLLFTLFFVGAVWALMKPRTGKSLWTLGLFVAAVAMNRQVAEYAAATRKEALFLALSFGILAIAERYADTARVRHGLVLGLLLALAYLTWPMGLVLGAAVVSALLFRKRWKAALTASLVMGIAVAGWSYRNAQVQTPENTFNHVVFGNDTNANEFLRRSPYNPELGFMTPPEVLQRWPRLIVKNLDPLANSSHPAFTVGVVAIGKQAERRIALAVPFAALMLVGWIVCVRDRPRTLELYMMFYLGAITLYPFPRVRYMLPLMPLALYYLFRGSDAVIGWLRRRPAPVTGPARPMGLLVLGSAVVLSGFLIVRQATFTFQDNFGPRGAENLYDRVDYGASPYFRAAAWLRDHTDPDAVIMGVRPWILYLVSDRHTTVYHFGRVMQTTIEVLHRHRVDYLIEDTDWYWQSAEFLRPVIEAYPEAFTRIHAESGPKTIIYRVNRSQLPPPGNLAAS